MRILLIPDATAPNGQDGFCAAVAQRALERGHQADIQALPPGQASAQALAERGFARAADVVVVNSLQPAALIAARAAGRKTALRLVDSYPGAAPESLAEIKSLALQADRVLVPSLYLENILKSWGANGSLRLVPYAYEHIMAQQIALVTIRASRVRGFQIIAGGPLNAASKPGFETLLSSVSRLRLDCHLSIVGDGPARAALEARVRPLIAADKVAFLGDIPYAKTMEYLRGAKVFVDPCGLEGFPTMTLHSLSEGCPVIGARAGALPELIQDGQNGLLFAPGDALGLSEAIVTLSSVKGLSLRLIAEGIKTVEKHSWDATVSSVFAALESL